ncbi:MAG: DUF2461 domain-containing protein [Ilumatobacteraceae bacterium]|jgi:uncharacterized protein (TIGR02453 family)|nr:DUF2461 domain-containing protein [Ilumatobacteraceae bacterium]
MAFRGIPREALDFYARLEADNTKPFWEANKATFAAAVRTPMTELTEALAEYGPFHLFRPHNDLRFARDRPPYKTHQGAYGESEGGAGYYVQLSASGLMAAAGYYAMASDQLERFRRAVDAERSGADVAEVVVGLERAGYRIGAISELKTAPRGYPKDHPRIELLRRKGLMALVELGSPAWLHTPKAADRVRRVWAGAAPLCEWLDRHVGPSTLPPDELR